MNQSRWALAGLLTLSIPAMAWTSAQAQDRSRAPASRRPAGGPLAARWIGQDGHDMAGPSPVLGPSDVQDIHIALRGLPPAREVAFAHVKGLGGAEWVVNGGYGPWKAALVRTPGTTTADLFIEPTQKETGRPFSILVRFDDGQERTIDFPGGRADPDRRMPSAALRASWTGPSGEDRVGPGAAVGPDGVEDVAIALANLSPRIEIRSVSVDLDGRPGWASGTNPKGLRNAELARRADDPSRAVLYLNPSRGLSGRALAVTVAYANDKRDRATVVAGPCDPPRPMSKPAMPVIEPVVVDARWIGQGGEASTVAGDVRVALVGLPDDGAVVAAVLSNGAQTTWSFRASAEVPLHVEPYALPLSFRPGGGGRAELAFPADRDERGGTMTLRLVGQDGRQIVARFAGGPCDPGLRAGASIEGTEGVARPGDDLNRLVVRFGTVRLSPGDYRLNRPLVLPRPVALVGDPGARIVFEQDAGDEPWTAAIKIHAGPVRLEGFAVRFSRPVRWREGVSYGPAVIGVTDNFDQVPPAVKADLRLLRLDLESPPSADPGGWQEAPRLIRLVGALNGVIEGNTLKGGMIEFSGGPWRIVANDHRGTPPGTFSYAAFAGHYTKDLLLSRNRVKPAAPCGKTWRFLVLTGSGSGDRVEENRVEGVGPRDDDTIPAANAAEIILTEAYSLHFEGSPLALSDDGRILQIPAPQADPARTGDAVAILSGAGAGQWRRVAQAIDERTYLIDPPLPKGVEAVSLASGFVGERFESNTIDCRGSSAAGLLVLVGNHFGTRVVGNRLVGGEPFKLTAAPTESPVGWGWSHAPFLGGVIEGNALVDPLRPGRVAAEHGPAIKASRGRVYLSASLRGNTVSWTRTPPAAPVAFSIGDAGSIDPGEALLVVGGNRVRGPVGSLRVVAATINGTGVKDRTFPLPDEEGASPGRVVP